MVNRGGGGRDLEKKVMNMGSDRSKPLHNFTMPSCLKWGNQKVLKCMKVENQSGQVSAVDRRGSAAELERGLLPRRRESERWIERTDRKATLKKSPSGVGSFSPKSKVEDDGDEGIDAFREKLITDLQTEAQRIKVPGLGDGLQMKQLPAPPPPPPVSTDASQRWNLRSKRGTYKDVDIYEWSGRAGSSSVHGGAAKTLKIDERRPNFSPSRTDTQLPVSLRHAIAAPEQAPINGNGKRPAFSATLSREEIEEDFMMMAGRKPHRRPKKRPRAVQRQVNALYPGLWLSEITPDLYKVPDETDTGKQR